MKDGYTKRQARVIMEERYEPRPSYVSTMGKTPEGYFEALMYNDFKCTMYPHDVHVFRGEEYAMQSNKLSPQTPHNVNVVLEGRTHKEFGIAIIGNEQS